MRILNIAAIALIASAGIAFADDISGVYGNTIAVTDADGGQSSYHFSEDGTYTSTSADGSETSGTWVLTEGQVCMKEPGADGAEVENCSTDLIGKTVGDTWEATGPDDSVLQVEVTAGQ